MTLIAYLAGPEVFLPDAVELGARKKQICSRYGLDGRFPLDLQPDLETVDLSQIGHRLFEVCVQLMDESDLIIANLTPFRGPSMDVGTAVEIGFMHARGRPVFGYTNVIEDYKDRVVPDGMNVEDFGFFDNLMCEGPIWQSKATVIRDQVPDERRFRNLRAFEACVNQAASALAGPLRPMSTPYDEAAADSSPLPGKPQRYSPQPDVKRSP